MIMTDLKRDYVLIIDKSGSMSEKDCPGGKSRWDYCQESTFALCSKMDTLDPDGVDLYVFASNFKKYPNTTADKVKQVFVENDPSGSTALDLVLRDAFSSRKGATTIIVVTDGEPNDKAAVARLITEESNKLEKDEDLAISFIQVGKNEDAKNYLKSLDDDLKLAKFDIVDTVTFDDMENMTLTEVLTNAIND
jgi:hypothetical protein